MDNLLSVLHHKKGERYLTALLGYLLRRESLQRVVRERVLHAETGGQPSRFKAHMFVSEERADDDGGIPDLRLQNEEVLIFLEVKVGADFTTRQLEHYWKTLRGEGGTRYTQYVVLAPQSRRHQLSMELGSWAERVGAGGIARRVVTWEQLSQALETVRGMADLEDVDRYLASMTVDFISQEVTGMEALTEGEIAVLGGQEVPGGTLHKDVAVLKLLALLDHIRAAVNQTRMYFSPNPMGQGPWVSLTINPRWRLTDRHGEEAVIAVYRVGGGQYRFSFELTDRVVEELVARGAKNRLADHGYRDNDGWLARSLFDVAAGHSLGPLSAQAEAIVSVVRTDIRLITSLLGRTADPWWVQESS